MSSRLNKARQGNELIICGPVYAELIAHPKVSEAAFEKFLSVTRIAVDFEIGEAIWREAARRFSIYARRRRQSGGKQPKRFLADFIIGAHALLNTGTLLTFDRHRYAKDFPELKLT